MKMAVIQVILLKHAPPGLRHLVEHLLSQGSADEDNSSFAREIDLVGDVSFWNFAQYIFVGAEVRQRAWRQPLHLLCRAGRKPRYSEEQLEAERRNILQEIARESRLLDAEADCLFLQKSIGAENPIGSLESISAATLQDVHAFLRRKIVGGEIMVGAKGKIPPKEFFKAVDRHLGFLPSGKPSAAPVRSVRPATGIFLQPRPSRRQVAFELGFEVRLKRGYAEPKYSVSKAGDALAWILGGFYSSEAYLLATSAGGCHDFQADFDHIDGITLLRLRATCEPQLVNSVIESYIANLRRIARYGVTATEFQLAVNRLLSEELSHYDRARQGILRALEHTWQDGSYTTYREYERDMKQLKRRDIQDLVRSHIRLDNGLLVCVGAVKKMQLSRRVQRICSA